MQTLVSDATEELKVWMRCTIVIHRCIALLFKNQCENVPSGLIMLGYFFVAILFLSSSDMGGP